MDARRRLQNALARVEAAKVNGCWTVHFMLPTGTSRADQCDSLELLAERVKHAACVAAGSITITFEPA